jgi:phenylacetate-CoA ligase
MLPSESPSSRVTARAGPTASGSARLEHLHTLSRFWRLSVRPRAELDAFRDRKLRFMVAHAAANVPFYRELFAESGVRAEDVRGVEDLGRLPIVTKRTLHSRPAGEVVADGVDPARLVMRYTAGSTGDPARVLRTSFEDRLLGLLRMRQHLALGVRLGDRIARVASPGTPSDRMPRLPRPLRRALPLYRMTPIDCLREPAAVVRDLVAARPDVIWGYASTLVELIDDWSRSAGPEHPPRIVLCGGDALTPALRARLRRGFGASVFETYGCHEVGVVASECPVTGDLHLCEDGAIVEVLRDGSPAAPGEDGEVVVTGLHSYAAPYLRYRLGDVATAAQGTCRCGASFATIRGVQGRSMDALVLPGGRVMHHWELVPMTFWDMPWHRQYQVVQEAPHRVALRVVTDAEPPAADLEHLRRSVLEKLGPGAEFRIERIDELERARSGKWRACVSRVDRAAVGG